MQVIGVCPIEFELRELGVVLERDALVAEVAPDLVDLFEVADQQAFEIKFERDAKIHILVEFVVMRNKGTRRRAAVQRLEDGRLHFEETLLVEKRAQ